MSDVAYVTQEMWDKSQAALRAALPFIEARVPPLSTAGTTIALRDQIVDALNPTRTAVNTSGLMYYEEAVIDGVLNFKTTPDGEWRPISAETLTAMLMLVRGERKVRHTVDGETKHET